MPGIKNSLPNIFNNTFKVLLAVLLSFFCRYTFAQAPNISYQTPQVYIQNNSISPLAPVNTGGAVPQTIYGLMGIYTGNPDGIAGSGNGTGRSVRYNYPTRSVFDAAGNLYVADRDNNLIRKATTAALVSTFAGSGTKGLNDGPAATASFNAPSGIAIDQQGNLYVTDTGNNLVRKITPAGMVSTFAGNGGAALLDGTGTAASFNAPDGITIDAAGYLYVADVLNNAIRKISPAGVVTTIAGNGTAGFTDANGTTATFNNPHGLCTDTKGNLYVADANNYAIRKIDAAGNVTTLAGSTKGYKDGIGTAAQFTTVNGIGIDVGGTLYVADPRGTFSIATIRKINPLTGAVTTISEIGSSSTNISGLVSYVGLDHPNDAIALAGTLYVTDYGYNYVSTITLTGYTIDKLPPAGLTFEPTTGVITGTPTAASPADNYTITAYNIDGSSTAVVNIEVLADIVFSPIPAKVICDADFDPGATGAAAVTYTSSNLAVAAIVAGKIHITGAGITKITATNIYGTITQQLIVSSPLKPVATIAVNNASPCAGATLIYTATVTNGGRAPVYQWHINGANTGINTATYTATNITATDIVDCMITNNDACPVSSTSNTITGINFIPYTTPTVTIQSSAGAPVCPGTAITFTATPVNGGANPGYQWQVNGNNAGTSAIFTSSTCTNGDVVTCTLTNQGGACLLAASATSNPVVVGIITLANQPVVTVGTLTNSVITGTNITFTATATNATGASASYQWLVNNKPAGTNSPTFVTNTLVNGDVVSCRVTAVFLCTITVTSNGVTAIILPIPPLVIPNTFTPNGDGINDTWNITNLAYYPKCTVSIYNRLGVLLYQSAKGYNVQWDGTFKGNPLPVGTYEYMIDTGVSKIGGSITVLR